MTSRTRGPGHPTDPSSTILFVIKTLSHAGGAEKILSELANGLAERGYLVVVASFDPSNADDFYVFGPEVVRERLDQGNIASPTTIVDLVRRILTLRRLARRVEPRIAIGFMHSAFVPLALASWGRRVPVVASEHTAAEHYRTRPLEFRLVRLFVDRFARVTVPSEDIRSGYPGRLRQRMEVVPNPVAFPIEGRAKSTRKPIILSVGRLREEKGHRLLVAAFGRIAKQFPDWQLRLAGDGPCHSSLEKQIKEAGLQRRVKLLGALCDPENEYATASILAVPSLYESFGLATAEGLARGIPAIGYADCPGTNELISDGENGLLVSGKDRVNALARGLSTLMSNPALRRELGRRGPDSVREYSLESIIDRWEELISDCVRKRD